MCRHYRSTSCAKPGSHTAGPNVKKSDLLAADGGTELDVPKKVKISRGHGD